MTGNYFSAPLTTFLVTVHDNTTSGYVVACGSIISPAGAYLANPAWSGRAEFAFHAKLAKGKLVPTGETAFEFNIGGGEFEFKSTGYTSLSIVGAKATIMGSGRVKNNQNYSFMLIAIDGQATGGGGVDKFGIKIWDKTTGQVVYDNTTGTLGPTPTQKGHIIIRK